MDGATAHVRLNRLLEGTQCGATTTEIGCEGVSECHVLVRWWPKRSQILKRPKTRYEDTHPTWDEAYAACKAWVQATWAPASPEG